MLLSVSVPSFMINLDSNIVAVSLPSIARSLHADFAAIEWVISTYTLMFASLVMPAGALADRYGRKRVLVSGLAIFTLASLICGAAPTVLILNVARAFQGLGAALQLSAALAILSHGFRGTERARAFAFWGSVIGIAMTLGPVTGGIITQRFGWQWAFYVNIPVGIVIIGIILRSVRESRDPEAVGVDVPGLLSFSASLFLLTFGLISGNHRGWTSATVLAELIGAAALFATFLFVETRRSRPMLDLSFFKRSTYIGSNVTGVAFAACFLTMLTYLPLYFQGGLSASPTRAGLLMLPMAIPLFAGPRVVSAYLTYKFSGRTLLAVGLALVSTGLFWMAMVAPLFRYEAMLVGMMIAGCGAGILNGESAKVGMTVIPPERAGMASGVGGTVRFSGVVIGFAALGAVLYQRIAGVIGEAFGPGHGAAVATLTRAIASGKLTPGSGAALASHAFGAGYQTLLFSAATFAGLSTLISWFCVRADETQPLARRDSAHATLVLPVE
ncbi:MAG TPA: MFS transporter [Acetobacteraceae bacterium]|nr:MFS transporter [Acetobacteraceae bacterium]